MQYLQFLACVDDDGRIPFSQRMGVEKAPQVELQEMPANLRTALWNTFQHWMFGRGIPGYETHHALARLVFARINWATDEVDLLHPSYNCARVKAWFFDEASWDRVYGFVEWLTDLIADGIYDTRLGNNRIVAFGNDYKKSLTVALERHGSPYRLSDGQLIPITDQAELDEVELAMRAAPYSGAREQIAQAVRLLSMKPVPDYRNTIKESVSAIESALKEATGEKKGEMPSLLAAFENIHGELHAAFRRAVSALYGWTSDASGVRHGTFGEVNVAHADARFMLVTCSAFVNFLVQHAIV